MGQVISLFQAMRGQRVYVDTNVFIAAAEPVLRAISSNEFVGFTGEIAVAETMVGPYRKMDPTLIAITNNFFNSKNFLTILPQDRAIFDHAARLRAEGQPNKLP